MTRHISSHCVLLVITFLLASPLAYGQSFLDEGLDVAEELRPLDERIREQIAKWFEAREAAAAQHGFDVKNILLR